MPIDFNAERWEQVKENAVKWWAGELDRPLIQMRLGGADPGRPEPKIPRHGFTAFYDLSVSAEEIVDRWDYDLSCERYLGDAFPAVWPNFGAGVVAALLGARLENAKDTVWFHPTEDVEIADLEWTYDPENVWLRRISDICKAAMDRWQGLVQVGMTDLGGNLDILASFRPGEKLLLDLVDDPGAVKQRTWAAHELWFRYFDAFNQILQPTNPGYTAWTPVYSADPYYMLQCDFCYMISPKMFDEFVRPELAATCKRLTNPFYHLDGKGQIPHMDSLLSIQELKGVQWIPGAGAPGMSEWPDVYRKIKAAGKRIQLFEGLDTLDAVADQIGGGAGIVLITGGSVKDEPEIRDRLAKWGVPA